VGYLQEHRFLDIEEAQRAHGEDESREQQPVGVVSAQIHARPAGHGAVERLIASRIRRPVRAAGVAQRLAHCGAEDRQVAVQVYGDAHKEKSRTSCLNGRKQRSKSISSYFKILDQRKGLKAFFQ